jgi:carbonic anhydrase/acetyltransferase-like protein (isoleucine patch superfamily)
MAIYALGGVKPKLPPHGTFWIAPDAHVIGDIELAEGVMVHTDPGFPTTIGENCTIGHHAIIHGCTIGNNSLVGMGATILNGARIGNNCLVGANALITEGKEFPDNSLIVGSPAKAIRTLDDEAVAKITQSAKKYVGNWQRFARDLERID